MRPSVAVAAIFPAVMSVPAVAVGRGNDDEGEAEHGKADGIRRRGLEGGDGDRPRQREVEGSKPEQANDKTEEVRAAAHAVGEYVAGAANLFDPCP